MRMMKKMVRLTMMLKIARMMVMKMMMKMVRLTFMSLPLAIMPKTLCCARTWSKTRCHKHPSTATATGATALLLAVNHVLISPPRNPPPPAAQQQNAQKRRKTEVNTRRLGARLATSSATVDDINLA